MGPFESLELKRACWTAGVFQYCLWACRTGSRRDKLIDILGGIVSDGCIDPVWEGRKLLYQCAVEDAIAETSPQLKMPRLVPDDDLSCLPCYDQFTNNRVCARGTARVEQ